MLKPSGSLLSLFPFRLFWRFCPPPLVAAPLPPRWALLTDGDHAEPKLVVDGVNFVHTALHLLSHLEVVRNVLDESGRHLADVDKSVLARSDVDESSVRLDGNHLPRNHLVNLEVLEVDGD